ncbi:MFS multidrug transporter [Colletotrichum musicola]|uniref:MFS multidrug transporter n=1 Tax=Colletotrichum musicola TaxID=2175873 RepID=A0A8H6NBU9_9PEZI|nr:MFS multidrug transporter [Colletotrichum musicola]
MEASESASRQRISQHLSYPNPSLGDTAGFAAANLAPRDADTSPAVPWQNSTARRVILVVSLLLGLLLSTLDTSVVATSLITISEEFHDHGNAPWVLLAYMLTYMGFSVVVSKMSDIYGRRTILFTSWGTFLIFSAGCTGAKSMSALIIFRALKGIGGAGLYSLTQICLLEHGPTHNPSLMGALIGITLALAFLLGPILGGAITSRVSWRWIFAINLPLGCIAMASILLCFPREYRGHRILSLASLRKIDFLGMISLLCASVTLVFGIQRGGSRAYSWNHPGIIVTLVTSGLTWILFVCWETYINKTYCAFPDHSRCTHIEPVFTSRLARRRPYMCGLVIAFLTGAPYVVLTVTIPERMQVIQRENPFTAGIHLLPMLSGTAAGSFLSGAICRKYNYTSLLMTMAAFAQLLGVALMLRISAVDSNFVPAYGFTLIVGIGAGLSFGASTIIGAVETESTIDIAVAQGAIAQARVLGSCLGVAISTVLFNNRLDSLTDRLTPQQLAILQQTPTVSAGWPHNLMRSIQEVYAAAFRDQTIFMMCLCSVMVFVAMASWEWNPRPISNISHAQRAHKASQQQQRRCDSDGTELSDMASVRSA